MDRNNKEIFAPTLGDDPFEICVTALEALGRYYNAPESRNCAGVLRMIRKTRDVNLKPYFDDLSVSVHSVLQIAKTPTVDVDIQWHTYITEVLRQIVAGTDVTHATWKLCFESIEGFTRDVKARASLELVQLAQNSKLERELRQLMPKPQIQTPSRFPRARSAWQRLRGLLRKDHG